MSFSISELVLENSSDEEQIRTRKIFEALKIKAKNNEFLTEHEKDFFCHGVKLSLLSDGNINDYDCCKNFKFKYFYLIYFKDLLGSGIYEKTKGMYLYKVGKNEVERDIKYLANEEREWLKTIRKENHSNELLKQISKETRDEIKNLKKSEGLLIFNRDKRRFKLQIRSLILQSKYIYLTVLEIFEMFDSDDFVLGLNGQNIEITEYSIIHILNRHFAQITKPTSSKSFHTTDFKPKYLNSQLKEIVSTIDSSGLLTSMPINKVAFRFKEMDYFMWVNKRFKSIKGKGNVEYNRVETFYPIIEKTEKVQLNLEYDCRKINNELSVYVKK